MKIHRFRNATFAGTIALWLWLCWAIWRQMVIDAADASELYARTASYQALNFLVGYLWILLVVLLLALVFEWGVFRVASYLLQRREGQASS